VLIEPEYSSLSRKALQEKNVPNQWNKFQSLHFAKTISKYPAIYAQVSNGLFPSQVPIKMLYTYLIVTCRGFTRDENNGF
jgi:hypothetical protein